MLHSGGLSSSATLRSWQRFLGVLKRSSLGFRGGGVLIEMHWSLLFTYMYLYLYVYVYVYMLKNFSDSGIHVLVFQFGAQLRCVPYISGPGAEAAAVAGST